MQACSEAALGVLAGWVASADFSSLSEPPAVDTDDTFSQLLIQLKREHMHREYLANLQQDIQIIDIRWVSQMADSDDPDIAEIARQELKDRPTRTQMQAALIAAIDNKTFYPEMWTPQAAGLPFGMFQHIFGQFGFAFGNGTTWENKVKDMLDTADVTSMPGFADLAAGGACFEQRLAHAVVKSYVCNRASLAACVLMVLKLPAYTCGTVRKLAADRAASQYMEWWDRRWLLDHMSLLSTTVDCCDPCTQAVMKVFKIALQTGIDSCMLGSSADAEPFGPNNAATLYTYAPMVSVEQSDVLACIRKYWAVCPMIWVLRGPELIVGEINAWPAAVAEIADQVLCADILAGRFVSQRAIKNSLYFKALHLCRQRYKDSRPDVVARLSSLPLTYLAKNGEYKQSRKRPRG